MTTATFNDLARLKIQLLQAHPHDRIPRAEVLIRMQQNLCYAQRDRRPPGVRHGDVILIKRKAN
jgi:hypothetical protein